MVKCDLLLSQYDLALHWYGVLLNFYDLQLTTILAFAPPGEGSVFESKPGKWKFVNTSSDSCLSSSSYNLKLSWYDLPLCWNALPLSWHYLPLVKYDLHVTLGQYDLVLDWYNVPWFRMTYHWIALT